MTIISSLNSKIDSLKNVLKKYSILCFLGSFIIRLKRNILFENYSKAFNIRRWIGWYLLCLMVHFFPRYAYLFSVRREIPTKSTRFSEKQNPLDDFEIHMDISDTLPEMEEINIVLKGTSFSRERLSSLKPPIFLVNWVNDEGRVSEPVPFTKGEGIFYVTGGNQTIAWWMNREGRTPIILIQYARFNKNGEMVKNELELSDDVKDIFSDSENYRIVVSHCSNHPFPQMSAVVCIAALCKLAKKVNIYGWDQYLDFEPVKHGYWKALFGLTSPRPKARPPLACRVEQALWNYHYAYRLDKLQNLNIEGRITQLKHHPGLINIIRKVFHND